VSPRRAFQGKVRCLTSHQSQPPVHSQWSRLVYFGVCALLEDWTPTHSSRHLLLVQCRNRKNGVSTATSRETSKPLYIDIHMCEHACVQYIIIVCTRIFIGACIHVVRYRHACYMHTYVYLLVWVHAHVFAYTRISRTTALGCRIQWQDFESCGAVVQSRGPVVHQLAKSKSGCMSHVAYPSPCSYTVFL
jgi:hypothetical protein